jgi:hypothetical protein
LTRLGINDPEVTKILTCWSFESGVSMFPSAEATEEVASLFPLEHCSKKARATLIYIYIYIYIKISSVNKRNHAITLRHVRAKHSTKYILIFNLLFL